LACVICGADTGNVICETCARRIRDPLILVYNALDPYSDQRLAGMNSASMRIHAVPRDQVLLNQAMDPAVRFREMMARDDLSPVPSFIDSYLSGVGIGLHVTGEERLPERRLLWEILTEASDLDLPTDVWARAAVKMANLRALIVRAMGTMPLGEAKREVMEREAEKARGLWSKADAFPSLRSAALANEALMDHWMGDSENALEVLGFLYTNEDVDWDRSHILIKRAMILDDLGQEEKLRSVLQEIPSKVRSRRVDEMRRRFS
jgi:hypothetical protein